MSKDNKFDILMKLICGHLFNKQAITRVIKLKKAIPDLCTC